MPGIAASSQPIEHTAATPTSRRLITVSIGMTTAACYRRAGVGLSPRMVPRVWSLFVRVGVFVVLEGACARLAIRPEAGGVSGAEELSGLLALCGALAFPGLALMAA